MERVTSRDGTSIAFERVGRGPPLVLIGGALRDRTGGMPIAEELASSLTAVAVDRRGRGESGDTAPYAVEREVEDVQAILGAVGGRGHLFGHSSGAVLTLEVARTIPEAVESVALYEPPFILDDSRPPVPEDFVDRLEELAGSDRRDDAVAYFLRSGVGLSDESVDAARLDPSWAKLAALAHTLHYDARVLRDTTAGAPDPLGRWTSLEVPALVMVGGASPPFQQHAVRALAATLPEASRRTLGGQGHGPERSMLAEELRTWVGDHTRERGHPT
ncbi:MAG TPA: alpha/beta hydrolase [Actinomycetota bacterium]|nr:alpha/beta hydrolase [Actinomycetota bacterium]